MLRYKRLYLESNNEQIAEKLVEEFLKKSSNRKYENRREIMMSFAIRYIEYIKNDNDYELQFIADAIMPGGEQDIGAFEHFCEYHPLIDELAAHSKYRIKQGMSVQETKDFIFRLFKLPLGHRSDMKRGSMIFYVMKKSSKHFPFEEISKMNRINPHKIRFANNYQMEVNFHLADIYEFIQSNKK